MNVPTRDDLVVALAVTRHEDGATKEEWEAAEKDVDQLLARVWENGWYYATNGKWGLPEKGENPYGEVEDA